jgi:hypothetical protein
MELMSSPEFSTRAEEEIFDAFLYQKANEKRAKSLKLSRQQERKEWLKQVDPMINDNVEEKERIPKNALLRDRSVEERNASAPKDKRKATKRAYRTCSSRQQQVPAWPTRGPSERYGLPKALQKQF